MQELRAFAMEAAGEGMDDKSELSRLYFAYILDKIATRIHTESLQQVMNKGAGCVLESQ